MKIPCILLCLSIVCASSGQRELPETRYSSALDSLRHADDLEEWIYQSLDQAGREPAKRLSILSATEAGAWRPARSDGERLAWFYLLANLGYYQLYSGRILPSIDAYERAYRWYFEHPLADADVIEYVLKPLGNNYTRLGDYDRAFFIQEKSLAIARSRKDSKASQEIASIYNNLAISARWKGEPEQAVEFCRKGLGLVKKKTPLNGLLLSTLADILLQQKNTAEAATNIGMAVSILESNLPDGGGSKRRSMQDDNTSYWLMSAYMVQGSLRKERGELAAALASYSKSLAIADHYFNGERKREKAKLKVLIGQTLLAEKRSAEAGLAFDGAISLLVPGFHAARGFEVPASEKLYGENTLLDALEGKGRALLAGSEPEAALDCLMQSFSVNRKLQREFFSREAKEQQQRENRQLAELAMQTAFSLWQTSGRKAFADDMLLIAENSKAQVLLEDITENLDSVRLKVKDTLFEKEANLKRAIAYYEREEALGSEAQFAEAGQSGGGGKNRAGSESRVARDSGARRALQYELSLVQNRLKERYSLAGRSEPTGGGGSADVRTLLALLPDSLTLVEYFYGDRDIFIIEGGEGGVRNVWKAENAGKLSEDIRDFMARFFRQGPTTMINQPQSYCERAWRIYRTLCDPVMGKPGKYLVVPDGVIGYLPFDALLTSPVSEAGPGQWPYLIRRATISMAYSMQTWHEQRKNLPVKKVDARMGFAGFFIAYDSSAKGPIPAVIKECQDIRSHVKGKFYTESEANCEQFRQSLDQAGILHISAHSFLQARSHLPVLQLSDGRFFLFELYGRAIQPQLVVLSACRTGDGALSEGEGIISLARGFAGGGAGGIVAGLWNMNDEATAELTGRFYERLEKGESPALALRWSKLEWLGLDHENPLMKLPYFWAGSSYFGNDEPVAIEAPGSNWAWYGWIGGAIGVSAILFFFAFLPRRRRRMKRA